MDNKGYVMGGIAFLLIIPAVILINMYIQVVNMDETVKIPFNSDKLHQISGDVESNIPTLTLQVLKEKSDNVARTGEPVQNSRFVIKSCIQSKIDSLNREYQKNTGITIYCRINTVDNSLDPYNIQVNSTVLVNKNNSSIVRNLSQNVPFACSDSPGNPASESYKILDPLPFIKTRGCGVLTVRDDKINYGTTLTNYLKSRGISNSEAYENASSPLYFKKCPYDPYSSHGNSFMILNLKNCIENGYYHESNDGSCLFCRFEGESTCDHYGLETFVLSSKSLQFSTAPCSIDHVIFGELGRIPVEIYPGRILEHGNVSYNLYLDNGHRNKYGLPLT